MSFRFLDHTADLAVEIDAASLDELFAEAVAAFTACLIDNAPVRPAAERSVVVRAPDLDRLLVRWLEEALVAFDVDGFLVGRAEVKIERLDAEYVLRGLLQGEPIEASRHPIEVLIKGVSYHGLRVEQYGGGWRAALVFDI